MATVAAPEISTPVVEQTSEPAEVKKPISEGVKTLVSRFTGWIKGRNPNPDAAFKEIADFPLKQNERVVPDSSLDSGKQSIAEETDKERIKSTQEYFDELKKISEGELSQRSVDQAQDILFNLAGKDDLVYSRAGEVTHLFNTIWGKAKILGFDYPFFEGRYVDDLHRLERRSEIAGVLKEFRELARTNPNIFDADSMSIYEFLTNGRQIDASSIGEFMMSYPAIRKNIEATFSGLTSAAKLSLALGWLVVDSKTLIHGDKPVGRFYLNLKPEYIHPVFLRLIQELSKNPNLAYQIKAPDPFLMQGPIMEKFNQESAGTSLARTEKVVLYFNDTNHEEIFRIIKEVCGSKECAQQFFSEKSKFAYSPRDSGLEMQGISFGQEPTNHSFSFNTLRAEVLKGTKSYINAPDFEERLMEDFKKHKIDPTDPAFNWPKEEGQDLFADIIP